MSISDSSYLKLVTEFSELNIDVHVSDLSYLYSLDGSTDNIEVYYRFFITFQHDFIIPDTTNKQFELFYKYSTHLEDLKVKYYREINELLDEEGFDIVTYNRLTDHKIHFQELLNHYKQDSSTKQWEHKKEVVHYFYPEDNKEYPIFFNEVTFFIHSAIEFHYTIINQIINYLNEKLSIFIQFKDQIQKKPSFTQINSKQKSAILDKYQTALLFDYLAKAYVIQDLSYNNISKLVSQLTGHSFTNLRNFCFNHIWEVKSGQSGNKIEIMKNPAYNLEKVKEVHLSILKEINSDIDKNNGQNREIVTCCNPL